jgi:hypothetical protein
MHATPKYGDKSHRVDVAPQLTNVIAGAPYHMLLFARSDPPVKCWSFTNCYLIKPVTLSMVLDCKCYIKRIPMYCKQDSIGSMVIKTLYHSPPFVSLSIYIYNSILSHRPTKALFSTLSTSLYRTLSTDGEEKIYVLHIKSKKDTNWPRQSGYVFNFKCN